MKASNSDRNTTAIGTKRNRTMAKSLRQLFEVKMFKTAAALTGGRFFNLAVSLVLVFIQSRFIGPDVTGFCQAFYIPVGYLWIFTLGVPSAIARELPYFLARGEREKALSLTQTAQSFSLVLGGLCASAFLILALRALWFGNYLSALGWGFQIINAFFVIYGSYITTTFRTTDEFIKIAKSNTVAALATLVAFPLIFWNPYFGLWTKSAAATLAANTYLYIKRPFKLAFGFNWKQFKPLVRFGLPLIAIGYIEASLWTSTQAAFILKLGGETYLGLFTFVNYILSALLIIPNAVAEILRPKFAAVYGESDGEVRTTLQVAVKPLLAAMAVAISAAFLAWVVVDDLIVWMLPKYVEAIPGIAIALMIVPVMTLHCIKYIFVVVKNMRLNFLATAPGFLVGIAVLYKMLVVGMDFKYIFLPYLIGQSLNFVTTLVILLILSRKERLAV